MRIVVQIFEVNFANKIKFCSEQSCLVLQKKMLNFLIILFVNVYK